MPFKPGQSGNPKGRGLKEKWATEAIRMALKEDDPVTGKKNLRAVAEKLVSEAKDGNVQAMKEIFDRLEGKPAQSMELSGNPDAPLQVVSAKPLDPEAWAKQYGKD